MNELILNIFIIAIAAGFILLVTKKWLNELSEKNKASEEIIEWLKSVGQSVQSSNQNVDKRLNENMKMFNERLDKAAYVIAQVQKNIGEFSEIGSGMKELQEFLQSPKIRGNIGEQILKDLLQQFLPQKSFSLQYGFKSGEKVDAVIKTSNGLIPIDAKFPMENYHKFVKAEQAKDRELFKKEFKQDIKRHLSDIAKKYILISEGTMDFALMYVPSEAIYYEIITDADIYDYSVARRVLIVSPMSFYAYLKAILMSFEGQKIEEKAREIYTLIVALKKDYEKADESLSVLNRHLTNAYNQISNVSKFFSSFRQKLDIVHMLDNPEAKKLS